MPPAQGSRRLEPITAVCISEKKQILSLNIPFISYTHGYQPTASRETGDINRITYLTNRYNSAIREALESYPNTEHLLVIDHYYLPFTSDVRLLVTDYFQLSAAILGASIWFWARRRVRPWIAYYDTLSAPEFIGKTWRSVRTLPKGIIPVSGVGACWIFPRNVWERSDGFRIPSPPQAGSSKGLDTSGYRVLLDCNSRLWRTHETNSAIPDFPLHQRMATSAGHARRKVWRLIRRRAKS